MRDTARATALAALIVLAAPSTAVAETRLGTHDNTGTQAFVDVKGDRVLFRSLGPPTVHVGYDVDVDGNGVIDRAVDVSYGTTKDGTLCASQWISERESSFCGQARTSARASQESIGNQVLRRIEVPLSEVTRNGRTIRLRLSMYQEGKGHARAWIQYDLATGRVAQLPGPSSTATATSTPAAPAAKSPSCPPTTAALAQWLAGRKVLERKKESPTVSTGGFTLFGQDGEDKIDTAGVTLLGAKPLRMTATIRDGKPRALWSHFAGHDIKPFEPAFRAEFGHRPGKLTCDPRECRWLLVEYPAKAPTGVLSDVSISLYNLTRTESTLSCRYGE